MAGLILWALFSVVIIGILAWRLFLYKKALYDFPVQIEKWLDDIICGREINAEQETEDTLYGRVGEKMGRVTHIWKRKAEETQKEKEAIKELISDISHQTKTPIANIKIYLELLDGEDLSAQAAEFLRHLSGQAEKLDFLLQSMVKMSRMETGIIQIQKHKLPLIDTLLKAVQEIVPKAEAKGICLTADCDEHLMLSHDRKWTEEAVFNILDNAVKYTMPGGKIHIAVSVQEIFTKISIKDSGKGIAPERQAEIFQRFYREPEVHEQEGIGIGLYLARKMTELQNGYIEVRSENGKGAEFCIYLPNES